MKLNYDRNQYDNAVSVIAAIHPLSKKALTESLDELLGSFRPCTASVGSACFYVRRREDDPDYVDIMVDADALAFMRERYPKLEQTDPQKRY